MINCPECGAGHFPGALFCDMCGAAVHPAARAHLVGARSHARSPLVSHSASPDRNTSPVAAPAISGPADTPRALRVRLINHQAEFIVSGDLIGIGRADPADNYTPEIDLTAYGGQARGVSRRHATLRWSEDGYVIVDQRSSNGTWLNGVRLVAGHVYPLPPEANLRFGGLLVQLSMAD